MISMNLSGIAFADLPHITNVSHDKFGVLVKGEEASVVRENGEPWDSDSQPAYSVRLGGLHVGYIPLIETVKEEMLKARDGYIKKWKSGYAELTKEQLREISQAAILGGDTAKFHQWVNIGKAEARPIAYRIQTRSLALELLRDNLNTDFFCNHVTPLCRVSAVYFDEKQKRNMDEIGDICSVVATFDYED